MSQNENQNNPPYDDAAIDYYLHSFRKDIESGDSAVIHCTNCEELEAMLEDLKKFREHRAVKQSVPVISGIDKILLGARKTDRRNIYMDKPKFSCGWYWSFGGLGTSHEFYHLKDYQDTQRIIRSDKGDLSLFTQRRNMHMHDALKEDYELNPKIEDNLWQFCELSLTIYALKEAAEIFYRGGSHTTNNLGHDKLKDDALYSKLTYDLIPSQCQLLWDLISV